MEISIGDYVLSGGELPAMVLLDACVRLLPGVMGAAESAEEESFAAGLLEYPHYTRPAEWQGRRGAGGAAVRPPRRHRRLAAAGSRTDHPRAAARSVGRAAIHRHQAARLPTGPARPRETRKDKP